MARRVFNPYLDPSFAQIGSNLVKAFVNDGKGAYYAAHTRKINLEADAQERKNKGVLNVADIFKSNPQGFSTALTADLYRHALQAGISPDQINKLALGWAANFNAPDSAVARAFVGAGHALGKDQGVSIADREGVAKRENTAALQRTATSAGIAAGASRANNADRLAMERDHFNRTGQSPTGRVFADEANLQLDPEQKRLLRERATPPDRFVVSPGANGPTYEPVRPGLPAMPPTGAQPPQITPKIIDDIEGGVLSEIGAGTQYRDKFDVSPEFIQQYGAQRERARGALSMALRMGRNAQEAREAYMRELGIQPGDKFVAGGGSSWVPWGNPSGPSRITRGGQTVTPAPAPAPTPSPPPTGQPLAPGGVRAAPPPDAPGDASLRRPGAIYQTPRGPMKWTGTGWVPAQP